MQTYNYIDDLFKAIFNRSKAINGRYYVGHKYGLQEINYDLLGQVLEDVNPKKIYPLVMMPPPHSFVKLGSSGSTKNGWKEYRINLFFCTTTYYLNNNITNINNRTRTSTQPIIDVWTNTDELALDFMQQLINIQENLLPSIFRVSASGNIFIVPFSEVSIDRISGVKLSFDMQVFVGCDVIDYEPITNYDEFRF